MDNRFLNNLAPRWIIFCCDIILISLSFLSSFFLVNHLSIHIPDLVAFLPALILNFAISVVCIEVFAIYKGIIRYSEMSDIVRIIKFAFLHFAIWAIVYFADSRLLVSEKVSVTLLLINFVTSIFVL